MRHDCEAGAVYATTVKQELCSQRLGSRICYVPRLCCRNCFRHDDAAGTVICYDPEAGTELCHDCGAMSV